MALVKTIKRSELIGHSYVPPLGSRGYSLRKASSDDADFEWAPGQWYDQTASEAAADVTPSDFTYPPGYALRQGAVNGHSITTALQRAIDGIEDGGKVILPSGFSVTMGEVNVNSKNIEIDGNGCSITLVGDNAGLGLHGTITRAVIRNWKVTGDATNRDSNSALAQIGILVGNESGDDISGVVIENPVIRDVNVGIKVAYGTNPTNAVEFVTVINPDIENCVGFVGGVGYGVQYAQGPGGVVIGGSIRGCQRHGLYFSEGENYRAIGVEVRDCGKGDGTIRGAVSVSRSKSVVLMGLYVHDNNDCGLVIDVDAQGADPNDLRDVNVIGGVYKDNDYGDFRFGTTSNPATDGVPTNVQVVGSTLVSPAAAGAPPIVINQCDSLCIDSVTIDASQNTSGSTRLVSLNATGGAQYTTNLTFRNLRAFGGSNTSVGIEIDSSLCTGTQLLNFQGNEFYNVPSEFSLGATITNPNLKRSPLNDSYTGTLTGCTTSPTAPIEFTRDGDMVTLEFPDFTATSNTTACTITGMPIEIRPAAAQTIRGIVVRDNGSDSFGNAVVGADGTITLSVGAGAAAFTNVNGKGIRACSFTYRRA
jgi:hypothetical protein